ncbi:hypothetical protein [Cohnella sp. REN36]|nr:hypothetical protein [Cohnella sp. REN36]MCC3371636.1 hypothetical protein [Cohnella sp. REN36]
MKLNDGQRLVLIGDSITDSDRKIGHTMLARAFLNTIDFDWRRMQG